MRRMRPVLILASERSGTNLLRKMLGMHPAIAAPPPPHLWRHLANVVPYLGPLDREENLRELARLAVSLTRVENSHLSWKHEIGVDEVVGTLRTRNLSGVLGALYEAYAKRESAEVWVAKENNLFDHAHRILEAFPDGKAIYLCRDGRDYACSIKKVPTHDQHVFAIAEEWKSEQLKCIQVYQDLLEGGLSCLVRYEDLIADPEPRLREVCDFIGVDHDPGMLEYHRTEDARREAAKTDYWKNLSKPVLADNKGKFLRELSRAEIRLFECVAGNVLRVLGYPLAEGGGSTPIRRWERLWYRVANEIRSRLKRRSLYREAGRAEREARLAEIYRIAEEGGKPLVEELSEVSDQRSTVGAAERDC